MGRFQGMKVVALAGGVGAGKFLRGVVRVVPPENVAAVVNTGDDIEVHGLHVSPDLDSVTYWLAGVADRERGWGRFGDTFRATEELREFGAEGSWFSLGDLDLATHLFRTRMLRAGRTLSEATAAVAARFGIASRILPMSEDRFATHIEAIGPDGVRYEAHFQVYWVARGGVDEVKGIRFEGREEARPAPGLLDLLHQADAILICPSNPAVSIGPILAVEGVRDGIASRRDRVVGVSPIVGGRPLRGMADKLLPSMDVEVSAAGVARHYRDLLGGWVIDQADGSLAAPVRDLGIRVAITDTVMVDDRTAAAVARVALELVTGRS